MMVLFLGNLQILKDIVVIERINLMTTIESDDETSIRLEIQRLENELKCLDEELYLLSSRRRLISHRIADLQYELRQRNSDK